MSASPYSANPSRYSGMTPEQLSLTLAIELSHLQQDVTNMNGKIDKLTEGKATRELITELSKSIQDRDEKIQTREEKTQERILKLEEWRAVVVGQLKLAYAFGALASTVSGVVFHFWK